MDIRVPRLRARAGAIAGAAVGAMPEAREPRAPVMGPGAVIGAGSGVQPDDDAARAFRESSARLAQESAAIDRRIRRQPRLPEGARETPSFPIGPGGVVSPEPAELGARATGTPYAFVAALTEHESGGDAHARAPTSSATGHGQFIDSTWLRLMRERGQSYGMGQGPLADLSDDDVLELRSDPTWSALMIGEYARENERAMRQRLGRNVREGEVYLGHWLGPEVAANLIKAAAEDQRRGRRGTSVRAIIGEAAFQANLPVMYSPDAQIDLVDGRFVHRGGGRILSPSEVIARQTARFGSRPFFARERGE